MSNWCENDVPVASRTKSDDLTQPMHLIDHTITKQDGPPDFDEEAPTKVIASVKIGEDTYNFHEPTIIPPPLPPSPKSGVELAEMLGVGRDEGVLLAVLPNQISDVVTQELPYLDKRGERCHVVLANLGAWGERALDIISPNEQVFRWWHVKEALSGSGHDLIPIRWQGAIGEIPEMYFATDYVLALRLYQHGPWFWPKEQPTILAAKQLEDAVESLVGSTSAESGVEEDKS